MLRSSVLARLVLVCIALGWSGASAPLEAQGDLVLVKEAAAGTPAQYHRPDCPLVKDGKGVVAMSRADAQLRGYKPHPDCDPAVTPSAKTPAGQPPSARPVDLAATEQVIVDAGGRYYHRTGCAKIGKEPHKVALADAGKRWPCPACRPPVRKRTDAPLVPNWRGDQ